MKKIGDYFIIEELPADEGGARFRVEHSKTGAKGVLRIFSARVLRNPSRMTAIRHAPELARDFHHPHASLPRQLDESEGVLFLLSDDAPGEPLAQRLARTPAPWPVDQALTLLRPLAEALDAAHAAGIFHGHPHSGNIFLDEEDDATLTDWGLAWSPEPDSGIFQTVVEEEQALTLAPELLAGNRPPGPEGDCYALAALAYHLFTGGWPYTGEKPSDRLLAQLTQDPVDPRSYLSELDEAQASVLLKGVSRDPATRFSNAREMIVALEEAFVRPWEKVGVQLLDVPEGPFLSGQGDGAQLRQLPSFQITRFPVTVAQFAIFVEETGYITLAEREGWGMAYDGVRWVKTPGANWRHPRGPETTTIGKENHPVVQIAWPDARAFCQWAGLEAPDEWQWEKAARGADGRLYPWGNDWLPQCCHHAGDGVRDTLPVDAFTCDASPYGVQGMAGNVWEWTASPYEPGSPYQVLRGGAWPHPGDFLTTVFRYYALPAYRSDALGFRCVSASQEN